MSANIEKNSPDRLVTHENSCCHLLSQLISEDDKVLEYLLLIL